MRLFIIHQTYLIDKYMRTVDLFAGCGGFSLGFQQAGFDIVAAFDNWQPAIDIYRENFNHPIFEQDLGDVEGYKFIANFAPELIIGGPPCQDFSSAGKRNENLGRANLTKAFANIVCLVQPTWFVMENVSLITRSPILINILEQFKENGYGLTSTILNASYCGVPQSRKRYFLIGKLGGMNQNLAAILDGNQSANPMTIFDYLGDSLEVEYYYRHPRSYQRRGIFSIHEPSPTVRGVNRPIPKTYQKHPGDACDLNEQLRPLTTIERSYLQTFPNTFKFKGNKSDLEQAIGNAVPVNLAKYVADCIKESIDRPVDFDIQQERLLKREINKQLQVF
jgi:DNA (cytosine-5)-methyltransferase 1